MYLMYLLLKYKDIRLKSFMGKLPRNFAARQVLKMAHNTFMTAILKNIFITYLHQNTKIRAWILSTTGLLLAIDCKLAILVWFRLK